MSDPLRHNKTVVVLVFMLCTLVTPALAQTDWEERTAHENKNNNCLVVP